MTDKQKPHSHTKLPGPKGLPLLGNLLQIDLKKLHLILEDWASVYGDIYQFRLANKTVVVISEPTLIQDILKETARKLTAGSALSNELVQN